MIKKYGIIKKFAYSHLKNVLQNKTKIFTLDKTIDKLWNEESTFQENDDVRCIHNTHEDIEDKSTISESK